MDNGKSKVGYINRLKRDNKDLKEDCKKLRSANTYWAKCNATAKRERNDAIAENKYLSNELSNRYDELQRLKRVISIHNSIHLVLIVILVIALSSYFCG